MDSGEFRAGNAAAALQFLARSIPYSTCSTPRPQREISDAEIDRAYRGARRGQESQKLRARRPDSRPASATGIVLEDTKSGVRLGRGNRIEDRNPGRHAGDRKKPGPPFRHHPINLASSYFYDSMEQLDRVVARTEPGYSYARYDNPTNARSKSS